MSKWIGLFFTVYITMEFIKTGLGHGRLRHSWAIVKRIRVRMIIQNIAVLFLVFVAASILMKVPHLDWSLWELIPHDAANDSTNVVFVGFTYKYFVVFYFVLFVLAVPQLALLEEKTFRKNTKDWHHGFWRSLYFGLAHCLVGVPLAFGFALTIGGLWFTHQYFKGGIKLSTRYHACWNLMLLTIIATLLLTGNA